MSTVLRSLMVKIGVDLTEYQKGMKAAASDMKKMGANLSSAGSALTKGITVPAIAAAAALGAVVMKTAEAADTINRLATITGLSTDRIQELQYAGTQLDVSLESITGTQAKLTKAMAAAQQGTKETSDVFQTLGIAVTDSRGILRDVNVVFGETLDALASMTDETQRDAMSLKLFGRSALELTPLIEAGGDEIRRLSQEAHDMGAVMDSTTVKAMDNFGDSMEAIKLELAAAASQIAMALLPALERITPIVQDHIIPIFESLASAISDVMEWFDSLTESQQNWVIGVGVAVLATGPLLSAFGSIATGISSLITLLGTLGAAMAGIVGGAAVLGAALGVATAAIGDWFVTAGSAAFPNPGSGSGGIPDSWIPGGKKTTPGALGPYKPGTGPYAPGFTVKQTGIPSAWIPESMQRKNADPSLRAATTKPADDPYAAILERQNALLKEQEAALRKSKAAAALDAFRASVKSLATAMMDAARSFANFTGAFDKVERDPVSGARLARRMQGQLKAVQDWVSAMGQIKGRVSSALYAYLRDLGPSAVDEIMALARDQSALADFAGAWEGKLQAAAGLGAESAIDATRIDQNIERQINTINVTGADPEKVAAIVVAKLRLAGAR